jgi:hypothetical protein
MYVLHIVYAGFDPVATVEAVRYPESIQFIQIVGPGSALPQRILDDSS